MGESWAWVWWLWWQQAAQPTRVRLNRADGPCKSKARPPGSPARTSTPYVCPRPTCVGSQHNPAVHGGTAAGVTKCGTTAAAHRHEFRHSTTTATHDTAPPGVAGAAAHAPMHATVAWVGCRGDGGCTCMVGWGCSAGGSTAASACDKTHQEVKRVGRGPRPGSREGQEAEHRPAEHDAQDVEHPKEAAATALDP